MCLECGCAGSHQKYDSDADHPCHHHGHNHEEQSSHKRVLNLRRPLMEKNDLLANNNRNLFNSKGLLVLNVLSSPGSGKTTFIRETAAQLKDRLRVGVIVGDLATDNDATRLRTAGVPVIQITTGTVCHLDADMVARAVAQLPLNELDVLVIENVGNLVCPADYDLGEELRVVLLSVTEGEDKPLKYPPMFHSAHVAVITKTDIADACGYNRELALQCLARISHHARIFELSARTGDGMSAWMEFLEVQWRVLTGR